MGTVAAASKAYLPAPNQQGLSTIALRCRVFHTNYLGSDQPSFTLNFSKGAAPIIAQVCLLRSAGLVLQSLCVANCGLDLMSFLCAQYYQFLRLGFDGVRTLPLCSLCLSPQAVC